MALRRRAKTTTLNLLIEIFFPLLPLVVLGMVWPHATKELPESFWSGPELSMTSCVLYGLTLARLLQGAVFAGSKFRDVSLSGMREVAASYGVLLLLPLMGVIVSSIFIDRSTRFPEGHAARYSFNLIISILLFFILGGHGANMAEGDEGEARAEN
jgi:cytochrome bd-type quinol oxidase subunit 2